jgi:hypothetical protein
MPATTAKPQMICIRIHSGKEESSYEAEIEGRPELRAEGSTKAAAIGELILAHGEVFGITIKKC